MQAGVCYWKDGVFWIGLLEDYPGYRTQGRTFQELKKNHAYPVSSQLGIFSSAASGGAEAQRCRARRRSSAPSRLRCRAGSGTR